MADEKKTDDYRINMPERSDSFNRPASPMVRASQRQAPVTDNAMVAILSYCASSILMTVTNKYVLSGFDFNLNFFLLCVQVSQNSHLTQTSADAAPVGCLRGCYSDMQEPGHYPLPGLQQR
jgi:hypothetical protein